MDKVSLNNQIVLCRPAVKRAKVCIIRKKIKKLKILKSCKKEDEKEKKSKKAERILEEILIMKKVRADDVTKFALVNSDMKSIIAKTPSNDHDHIYATIASHPHVSKMVETTRALFPSSDDTLPSLLESLGNRTLMKKLKVKSLTPTPVTRKQDGKSVLQPEQQSVVELTEPEEVKAKVEETSDYESGVEPVDRPATQRSILNETKKTKQKKKRKAALEEYKDSPDEEIPEIKKVEPVKVEDAFFVDKKVIQPKLLSDEQVKEEKGLLSDDEKAKEWLHKKRKPNTGDTLQPSRDRATFRKLPPGDNFPKHAREHFPFRKEPTARKFAGDNRSLTKERPVQDVSEKLHPSWAAKKAQTIKPFEGKKIKFDDN